MNLPGAVSTARLPERVRTLVTLVNLHYAGAGLLLLLNLYLALQLGLAWHTQSASGADALAQSQAALRAADLQARPLQGLDAKLGEANGEADAFYTRRLPGSYSGILTELGSLTHREGVKLSRGQYAQASVLDGTANALTEIRTDATLTGDYSQLVHFINALERDRMFFLISGVALTGQQGGAVGLRLRLTTYLRPGALLDQEAANAAATSAEQSTDSSEGPAAAVSAPSDSRRSRSSPGSAAPGSVPSSALPTTAPSSAPPPAFPIPGQRPTSPQPTGGSR